MEIAVIGAGATGLTAAWKLSLKGNNVTVYEKSERLGGLCSAVTVGDDMLDIFYHHVFTNDTVFIDTVRELGMCDDLKWYEPKKCNLYQ